MTSNQIQMCSEQSLPNTSETTLFLQQSLVSWSITKILTISTDYEHKGILLTTLEENRVQEMILIQVDSHLVSHLSKLQVKSGPLLAVLRTLFLKDSPTEHQSSGISVGG